MDVGILGPLAVRDASGAAVEVAGARLRALLCRLALDAGRAVSVGALVDAVWGDEPPADAANALQALVSRLRRTLGEAAPITQSAGGYRLAISRDDVDAFRFEELVTSGGRALRAGDAADAAAQVDDALQLWRGPMLADDATAARFDQLRVTARIDSATARIALGEPERALADITALHGEHPLDERVGVAVVLALAAAGRQADALRTYDDLRRSLADELGVDPGAELQAAHLAVLRGETEPQQAHRRSNLRAQLTSFVGRDEELARVAKALGEHRLVTIVGPGGAGKTRLASEAGVKLMVRDGVWLAELAAVTDGADVPQAVLGALGLREKHLIERRAAPPAQDAETRLAEMLADKTAVIVLDNCEHVIDASARIAEHLLGLCPDVRVLATSREPLGIIGEVVLAVPPLGQPPVGSGVEFALEFPAVRLFADRAAAARPDVVIDERNIGAVVEIVRRLDGLPLAIELAAARLRAMSINDIAERLSNRFRLLTGGSRTALPRHRTLRAVVEWSWDLLNEDERLLAERVAVFPAGVTVASASTVCSDAQLPSDVVPELLADLLDKSLLQLAGAGERYRMLETIREYGMERLADRGELETIRARHADHFADLVRVAQEHLISAGQLPWFEQLTAERENIFAALRFRCESQDAEGALQVAVDLGAYAMMTGSHDLGPWLEDALAVPGADESPLRWVAVALAAMSAAASGGDSDAIDSSLQQLGFVAERLAETELVGRPLLGILRPAIAFFAGLPELTDRLLAEGLASDHPWTRAAALMFRANVAENNGDIAAMQADIELALDEFRVLGERWGLSNTLSGLATLLTLQGELDRAEAAIAEALELMRLLNSTEDETYLLVRLADVALRRGEAAKARDLLRRAVDLAEESGAPSEVVFTLTMLADVERQLGGVELARAMSDTALARLDAMLPAHPALAHVRAVTLAIAARLRLDDDVAASRTLLDGAYEAAVTTNDAPIAAMVGVVVAATERRSGNADVAAEVLGAASAMRGADDLSSVEIARLTGELRAELGDDGFETAYARGKGLDRAAALKRLDPTEALMR